LISAKLAMPHPPARLAQRLPRTDGELLTVTTVSKLHPRG
jgi:hypothetical protein